VLPLDLKVTQKGPGDELGPARIANQQNVGRKLFGRDLQMVDAPAHVDGQVGLAVGDGGRG
jgi:hypothetical protein